MPTTPPPGSISVSAGSSIQSAVNAASNGATFWLEAGVHRMQEVTPKAGQTFIGADGAILNGSRLITSFTQENGLNVASGQTQQGDRNGTSFQAAGAERAGYPEAFFINDQPLTPVDSLSKVTYGKFYFDYANDKIYFKDDPTDKKVEASASEVAFTGTNNDVTIQNLIIEKYSSPVQYGAIHTQGANWTIDNNEVRLNYGVGIYTGDDANVTNNYVHDNGEMGLGGNGDRMFIDGNEIAFNGWWSGIEPGWEGGGTKWAETDLLVVTNNYSHDNHGYGLWTDINNHDTLYQYNTVVDNTDGGIVHEISADADIRDNIVIHNGFDQLNWLWGAGILLQNSKNVEVFDNQVQMDGGNGITLIQQARGATSSQIGSGTYGDYYVTGNSIHDNLVVGMNPDQGAVGMDADFAWSNMQNGGNTFNNNDYRVSNLSDDHWNWEQSYGWTAFKTATGFESTGTASTTPASIVPTYTAGYQYVQGTWHGTSPFTNIVTTGTSSNQTINGTSGNDRIDGVGGEDTLVGGNGDDTYVINSNGDTITETSTGGVDLVIIHNGVHQMGDHVENAIADQGGPATIYGSNQDNWIIGGTDDDTLVGDSGADKQQGGDGNDTFVLRQGEVSGDIIMDFTGATLTGGDFIRLENFGTGATLTHDGDIWRVNYNGGASTEVFRLVGVDSLSVGDYQFF